LKVTGSHKTTSRRGKLNAYNFINSCEGNALQIQCVFSDLNSDQVQPLRKTIWRLLKNLNIDLPYDPAIPLLGIYPKECDTGYSKGTCTPMFIASLFTIAKLWKQPKCPTIDEQIKKMWYLYTMEYYSAMKKNEILLFAGKWMELENIILREVSQAQKTKNHMFSLTCRL
jgi:hypothetical protein